MQREAMHYKKLENKGVRCILCGRQCLIRLNGIGVCGVRKNVNGVLYSLVYGKAASIAVDPIEKKPLYHFAPGSQTLSLSTVGCNFKCKFCQNWEISQPSTIFGEDYPPKAIIEMARNQNLPGISWTYTEPTIFYEYFYDTAKLDRNKKFYQVFVSNGYMSAEVIKTSRIDAVNVDYKGNEEFYRKLCAIPSIEPVHAALKQFVKQGVWVEITNLLILGYNDSNEIIKEMVEWIVKNLGTNVPLHFSRYFPTYKLNAPATPTQTLERAYKIAKAAGINYVYLGNLSSDKANTYCPNCNALLIRRGWFSVEEFNVKNGKCFKCKNEIPLAGMKWSPFA